MVNSYHNSKNASLYEPRIILIKRVLESLLSVIDLENKGEIVKVDGFRLKDLQDWLTHSHCDPAEIFEYAGTRCDCDCVFCYNKGTPPELALINPARNAREELAEMETRLQYFRPGAELSLFTSLGSTCEILIQPHILEVLKALRVKTSQCFRIPTNGTALNSGMIEALADLKPLYLDISLNSASEKRRRRLMHCRNADVAIKALPLLEEKRIPYSVVIVPWPVDSLEEMLKDLKDTVLYADKLGVHLIQISLPGYTGYFSNRELFNLDELWGLIMAKVRELRSFARVPIVVMPSLYEENIYEDEKNIPGIIGIVNNSPAARGGLRQGDLIVKINSLIVRNKPQARDLLSLLQKSDAKSITVTVKRNGELRELRWDLEDFDYPYSRETDSHLGVVLLGSGFRVGYLEKIQDLIRSRKAKRVIILSSKLMRPTLEQCLRESHICGGGQTALKILVPENRFFKGNIFMGDLLVVQDFIDCIRAYIAQEEEKPDLAIIPSSPFNLSQWGRDLTGRAYLDIERQTGVPVELLPCATIYD